MGSTDKCLEGKQGFGGISLFPEATHTSQGGSAGARDKPGEDFSLSKSKLVFWALLPESADLTALQIKVLEPTARRSRLLLT